MAEFLVPRHMRTPGEDGYRTPTIEDAQQMNSILGHVESQSAARDTHTTALEETVQRSLSRTTGNSMKQERDHCADPYNGNAPFNRGVDEFSASKLSWKIRIRHVTWAYFTLTMATGGLANVLYEGKNMVQ